MRSRFVAAILDEKRGVAITGEVVTLHYDYLINVVNGRCHAGFGINLQGFEDNDGKVWGIMPSALDSFNMFAVEPMPGYQLVRPAENHDLTRNNVLDFSVDKDAMNGIESTELDDYGGVFLVFKTTEDAKSWVEKYRH